MNTWIAINYTFTKEDKIHLAASQIANMGSYEDTYWLEHDIEYYILKGNDGFFHGMRVPRSITDPSYRAANAEPKEIAKAKTIKSLIFLIEMLVFKIKKDT